MANIAERLKLARKNKGLTQPELAEKIKVHPITISKYEGGGNIPNKVVKELAKELDVDEIWLLTGIDSRHSESGKLVQEKVYPYDLKESVRVPLLGKIPAGFPQVVSQEVFKEYVYLPQAPKGSYALIVKGDSMRPTISDGDYVLFKPDGQYADGSIVVASNEYGDPTLKRYRIKEGVVRLVSDNPEFHALDISEQWRVLGVVIKVWRDVKF
jgi:SOS-response transcriptional repressor LexA